MQKRTIIDQLQKIEQEAKIRILYAVESGSRAWGFASTDSDWDIRFIYIQPRDAYLSIDREIDYLEYPIQNGLDVNGWDLKKALTLFRKSNPPLFEWLRSPIVYLEQSDSIEKLRVLAKTYFNPKTCMHHYLHMAEGNYREYLKQESVRIKKYFYVLRPLLACQWIENNHTMPPMEFEILVKTQIHLPIVRAEIEKLLTRKRRGDELDRESKNIILNSFIDEQIDHFNTIVKRETIATPDRRPLDTLFREELNYHQSL